MINIGQMVKIKKTGEKGRFLAIYPARDGTTLLIKTPAGDRHVDTPAGAYEVTDYLNRLPKQAEV